MNILNFLTENGYVNIALVLVALLYCYPKLARICSDKSNQKLNQCIVNIARSIFKPIRYVVIACYKDIVERLNYGQDKQKGESKVVLWITILVDCLFSSYFIIVSGLLFFVVWESYWNNQLPFLKLLMGMAAALFYVVLAKLYKNSARMTKDKMDML